MSLLRTLPDLFSGLGQTLTNKRTLPTWGFLHELGVRTMRTHNLRTAGFDVKDRRAMLDALGGMGGIGGGVRMTDETIAGIRCTRFTSKKRETSARRLVWLHGGAFQIGSEQTHGLVIAELVRRGSLEAWMPHYRLAPEHPFPAAHEDARAVVDAMAAQGPLVLGGDSAGGNLVLSVLSNKITRAALVCPWVDLEQRRPSYQENDAIDWITRADLHRWAQVYCVGIPPSDPRVSPLNGELKGLPPLFVQYGGAEVLRDDSKELVTRLRAAGNTVTEDVEPEMVHDWHSFVGFGWPEAKRSLQKLADFLSA